MASLVASKEKMFITQTKLHNEVTWKTVMQIAKKHAVRYDFDIKVWNQIKEVRLTFLTFEVTIREFKVSPSICVLVSFTLRESIPAVHLCPPDILIKYLWVRLRLALCCGICTGLITRYGLLPIDTCLIEYNESWLLIIFLLVIYSFLFSDRADSIVNLIGTFTAFQLFF